MAEAKKWFRINEYKVLDIESKVMYSIQMITKDTILLVTDDFTQVLIAPHIPLHLVENMDLKSKNGKLFYDTKN